MDQLLDRFSSAEMAGWHSVTLRPMIRARIGDYQADRYWPVQVNSPANLRLSNMCQDGRHDWCALAPWELGLHATWVCRCLCHQHRPAVTPPSGSTWQRFLEGDR